MVPAFWTYLACALEFIGDIDVPTIFTFVPRIGRDFELFSSCATRTAIFAKPGHDYGKREKEEGEREYFIDDWSVEKESVFA